MTIWKGGPVNNIDELGAGGNIICIGPFESVERFLEYETAEKYFDEEVHSTGSIGWEPSRDEITDEENDIREIQIALTWFNKLIPTSTLNLILDYPDCDFEIICDFNERELSYWLNVRNYKKMPLIAELLENVKMDGSESMIGSIYLGKSYNNYIHEELELINESNECHSIRQDIKIVNNIIDFKKSFFLSKEHEEGSDINQNCEAICNLGSIPIGNPVRELRQKFEKTEVYKKYNKLFIEKWGHHQHKRYEEALRSSEELLNIMPEFYEAWISMKGNKSTFDFFNSLNTIDFTMKAYVVLMDRDKMNKVMMLVKNLHSLLGNKLINIEIIKQNFDRYYNDINLMKTIYDFLKSHPEYPQKKIYKALSFSGKTSAYVLEYAEKFGKISRIRHGDSWQLTYLT